MKLKAFTLVEMIVTMILSAITILAALWIFAIISNSWTKRNKNYLIMSEWLQFESTFKRDVRGSDFLNVQDNTLMLKELNRKIKYTILGNSIIREMNNVPDTIFHGTSIVEFVQRSSVIPFSPLDSMICLEVSTQNGPNKLHFFFVKPLWAFNLDRSLNAENYF